MTPIRYSSIIKSPIGLLGIVCKDDTLHQINFVDAESEQSATNNFSRLIKQELDAYFENPRHSFSLPLSFDGTPYQKTVWKALLGISVGQTKTYGELADELHSSPRAIGNACRNNPIPIIIPCHRIVAKNHIGGYSGATDGVFLSIKERLLRHEQVQTTSY